MVDRGQDVNHKQDRKQYREIQVNGQQDKGEPTPSAPSSAKAITLETRIPTRLISKARTASVAERWEWGAGAGSGEPAEVAAAGTRELRAPAASPKESALQPVGLKGKDQSHDRQNEQHEI